MLQQFINVENNSNLRQLVNFNNWVYSGKLERFIITTIFPGWQCADHKLHLPEGAVSQT